MGTKLLKPTFKLVTIPLRWGFATFSLRPLMSRGSLHATAMSLIFWIAVGLALSALLIGLLLKARLGNEPIFEELVHPDTPLTVTQSQDVSTSTRPAVSHSFFSYQAPKPHR